MIKDLALIINETEKLISNNISRRFKEHKIDITFEQYTILYKLWKTDSVSQCKLAQLTNRDQASASRIINTLIKNDLIIRKCCSKDKRINRIELTEKGLDLEIPVLKIIDECLNDSIKDISKNELNKGIDFLNALKKNLIQ